MWIYVILLFIVCYILIDFLDKKSNKSSINYIKKVNNNSFKKGKIGEDYICNIIENNIDVYHKIVRNVYIEDNNKKTEIDIIFITAFGIYVIESKNYTGYIYGNENDFKWTQYFNKIQKNYFLNPIKQNNYHIKFLSEHLNRDIKDFKSYIVFGTKSKLRKIPENSIYTKIIQPKYLVAYLIDDMHNSGTIFSHEEVDKIYIDLKYYCEHFNIPDSDNYI